MTRRMNWDRERIRKQQAHDPLQSARAYLDERKPITQPQRRLIRSLRVELGIGDEAMPETCREARALITDLMDLKRGTR